MRVEIRYVRRKLLAPYVPDDIWKTIKTKTKKSTKVAPSLTTKQAAATTSTPTEEKVLNYIEINKKSLYFTQAESKEQTANNNEKSSGNGDERGRETDEVSSYFQFFVFYNFFPEVVKMKFLFP